MRSRTCRRALLAALTALALAPAVASADSPWSTPASVTTIQSIVASTFTASGQGALVGTPAQGASGAGALVAFGADGTFGAPQPIEFLPQALVTYATSRIVVAGRTIGDRGIDDKSYVAVSYGSQAGVGQPRRLPGSRGKQLFGIAADQQGDLAVVTGDAGGGSRDVWLRRAGSSAMSKVLTVRVGTSARDAQVAVGPTGDVLLVYEDDHGIYARHIGPKGTAGAQHRLGDGVQSTLRPLVESDGRLDAAWLSQRVGEGDAENPATITFITAAPGHGFGSPHVVNTPGSPTGAGRYVSGPGVVLTADGERHALLAYTDYGERTFVARARAISGGHLGAPQTVSPAGVNTVLGDARAGADGGAVVLMRENVSGADPTPAGPPVNGVTTLSHPRLAAAVRASRDTAFAPLEQVSADGADVLSMPFAAIDPVSRRSVAVWSQFNTSTVLLAVRPAP